MALHLVIGNKNYSSWSFRPWLAMKVAGIAFEETVISLEAEDFKARVMAVSGAGKVPVLIDGEIRVWESLAILEYLAEKFPAAALWPNRRRRPRACACDCRRNARRLCAAAPSAADECVAAGEGTRARRWGGDRCSADRSDLERLSRAISARPGRFCSARSAPPTPCMRRWSGASHLRGRSERHRARLHARRHGAAGVERMAGRRAARALGAAARRGRLAGGVAGVDRSGKALLRARAIAAADRR